MTTTLGLAGRRLRGSPGTSRRRSSGSCAGDAGEAKNTYGTGCFLLQNIGTQFVRSKHRLITTLAASAARRLEYAFEGSIFIGGAVVQWLRDNLCLIGSSADVEALAAGVPDTGGVVFVPAFRRAGRAALGSACRRADDRPAARHHDRATLRGPRSRASHSRSPTCSRRWRARPTAAGRAACGWRRGGEQLADAVSGGCAGRSGRAAPGNGDDSPGRGISCRTGGRLLGRDLRICGQAKRMMSDLNRR